MLEKIVVSNETEAWALLESIVSGEVTPGAVNDVVFSGWPNFSLYIPDHDLDSALTPYMMQGFIDFQRSIYRTHALIAHDVLNARTLSDVEKERLQLVVRVESGSSSSEAELLPILKEIGVAAVKKMEPQHIIVTLLGLGVLWASTTAWRAWLQSRAEEKKSESQSKTIAEALAAFGSAQEKDVERMKIFADAVTAVPQLGEARAEDEDAKQSIVRHVSKNAAATINGVEVSGEAAAVIARETRREAVERRLDGMYRILRVDTTSPEGFRVRLESGTGDVFDAGVQDALLSEQQKSTLQQAEWKKRPVFAEINARVRRDESVEATVINARETK